MRTLIVSDLHLGLRSGVDVLRNPEPLARLLRAIDDVDRLVLLGDTFEPIPRTARPGTPVAEQAMRAIGRALGPDRTVVVVPGNHDGRLVRSWALARGESLGIADDVDAAATPELSMLASWLAPAQVSCSYPGFWVSDRIWATHGHYLDRHLMPETAFGLRRSTILRWLGRRRPPADERGTAIEYEWARRRSAARRRRGVNRHGYAARLRDRPLATLLESAAALTRIRAMPQVPHLMMRINLAPVTARLVNAQMRGAAMPAMAEVAQRLGVGADWIVFGHVHRLGPRDEPDWQPLPGGPRLLNTGSWVFEPVLLDRVQPPHPYWPGGAIIVESDGEPRPTALLDDLTREQLTGAAAAEALGQRRQPRRSGAGVVSAGSDGCRRTRARDSRG